jgi:hypothetical protein
MISLKVNDTDIARYSLTITLLAFDTGKIRSIIMSDDSSLRNELARRSLLSLSENSASDAVSCLEELNASAGVPQSPSSVKVASGRHRRRHGVHMNKVLGEKKQEYHRARCDKNHGIKVASEGDNAGKPKARHMEAKEANKKPSFHKATKQKSIGPVRMIPPSRQPMYPEGNAVLSHDVERLGRVESILPNIFSLGQLLRPQGTYWSRQHRHLPLVILP